MRIVHLTSHIGQGGDWTIVRTLAALFERQGHQTVIGGCEASKSGFDAIELPLNQGGLGFARSLLRAKHLPSSVDIVHAHTPVSLLLGLIVKTIRYPNSKLIYTFHWKTPDSSIKRLLKILLFNLADAVHAYSQEISEFLLSNYQLPSSKVFLAYIGVDPSRFNCKDIESQIKLRQTYGIEPDACLLLFVGRLSPEKNVSPLLDYLGSRPSNNMQLAIAGDGPLRNELERQAKNQGIEGKVKFWGYIDSVEQAYIMADLLVLPSLAAETFGMVVVEAALCGTPTLRSDLPGAKDQIIDGENSFIFPAQNPGKLFDVLDQIWADRSRLPSVGQKAREHALNFFNLDRTYEQMVAVYNRNG